MKKRVKMWQRLSVPAPFPLRSIPSSLSEFPYNPPASCLSQLRAFSEHGRELSQHVGRLKVLALMPWGLTSLFFLAIYLFPSLPSGTILSHGLHGSFEGTGGTEPQLPSTITSTLIYPSLVFFPFLVISPFRHWASRDHLPNKLLARKSSLRAYFGRNPN